MLNSSLANSPHAKWERFRKGAFSRFNIIASCILLVGALIVLLRFTRGIGAVTNLDQTHPWGIWIGFDVLVGVALAAGGFMIASAVHILGLKEYRVILRPAILTGFLGYFFVVVALIMDLGRPWRLPYPMVVSLGAQSVMFLVAWHVALYLTVQFLEFSPAVFEWRHLDKARKWVSSVMVGICIAGVILSLLHQSALGALFLLAPTKVHPLWYSPLMPLFFFASAVIAGLSMVIVESWLSHRYLAPYVSHDSGPHVEKVMLNLGKFTSVALMCYLFVKIIGLAHNDRWAYLDTPMGAWFLVELGCFVLLPALVYAYGWYAKSLAAVRLAALVTLVGIIINRLNVSVIGFQYNLPDRYIPSWMEVMATLSIVTLAVVTYRWIVVRMPVLRNHPDYAGAKSSNNQTAVEVRG